MFKYIDKQGQVAMTIEIRQQAESVAYINMGINEIIKRRYIVRMDFDAIDSRLPFVVVLVVLPKFEMLTRKDPTLSKSYTDVQSTCGPCLDNQSDNRVELVQVAGRPSILPLTGNWVGEILRILIAMCRRV